MTFAARIERLAGPFLAATTLLVVAAQAGGGPVFAAGARASVAAAVLLLALRLSWGRRLFLMVGAGLAAAAVATRPDWPALIGAASSAAAFIAAFFTATTALRHAATESEAVRVCGRFLAEQPPGRRYAALTLGGHLFAIPLNYGAIALLGGMAETSARDETDAELRALRLRRMLTAVHRGFASTLAWSPLAFAMALATSFVPGGRWDEAAGLALGCAALIAGVGWVVDAVVDRPSAAVRARARRPAPSGLGWRSLTPLWLLLALLAGGVAALGAAFGLGAVAAVMVAAPAISLGWVALQRGGGGPAGRMAVWGRRYVVDRLLDYRGELVILTMAGFIGSLGGALLAPFAADLGADFSPAPAWTLLVGLMWYVPLMGQFAMNPILSVSLLAPLLPEPASVGLSPGQMVAALTAGWAIAGVSSPFTAGTIVVGAIAGVPPRRVGLVWNGLFLVAAGGAVSLWLAASTAW